MDNLYIQKVLNGETEEFRYFIKQYKDMAFSVALSVVKEEFLAVESVQEAFIKAYENLQSFKRNSKFSTWFYRIVVNESIKIVRKNRKIHVNFDSLNEAEYEHTPQILKISKKLNKVFLLMRGLRKSQQTRALF